MKRTEQKAILLILGIGQSLCYLFLFCVGNLRTQIIACEVGFFSAFLLYGVSLFLLRVLRSPAHKELDHYPSHCSFTNQRFCAITILCFSLLFRMIMWLSPPALSDDIYRYLWEGKLLVAGINPFTYAPSDPSLEHLHDLTIFLHINHKEYAAIYPPLNQFIFALSTLISPTITTMNLTFILFDLFTMLMLMFILRDLRMDLKRIIIYAWNPLIIMEFAGSGHLDSAGIFFLMLALYLCTKKRTYSPTIFLSLSFLNKFLPLIFLPFILTRKKVLNLVIFLLTVATLYIPFSGAGKKIFLSLLIYSQQWVFNASLYEVFLWMVSSPLKARGISFVVLFLIVTGLFVWYKVKKGNEDEGLVYRVSFIALGSLLLLTPVLHPWYLCWMVPLLVIYPNRAWMFLTGSVFLSYWVLKGYVETGVWKESVMVKTVEYLPFYSLLLFDSARRYRTRLLLHTLNPVWQIIHYFFHSFPTRKTNE